MCAFLRACVHVFLLLFLPSWLAFYPLSFSPILLLFLSTHPPSSPPLRPMLCSRFDSYRLAVNHPEFTSSDLRTRLFNMGELVIYNCYTTSLTWVMSFRRHGSLMTWLHFGRRDSWSNLCCLLLMVIFITLYLILVNYNPNYEYKLLLGNLSFIHPLIPSALHTLLLSCPPLLSS